MKNKDGFQMVDFADLEKSRFNGGYQLGRPSLVRKCGRYRIAYKGIGNKGRRYLLDLYQTLIDMKWRWVILFVAAMFLFVYLVFAILWYLTCLMHGDFDHIGDPNWKPCVVHMETFADALLFSIETQTTIGYGTLYPNTSCGPSLPLIYLQITIGFAVEVLLLGIVLVKIARPKHRRHTLLFSSTACVCKEEGDLVLQVRLGDIRQSHLVDTSCYGIFIKDKVSEEGVHYPLYQHHMDFEAHGMDDRVFLIWPLVLNHRIDESSPLWGLKPEDILHANNFEIVVVLEGTIESTGEICQARTSFTSKDILWGYRFSNIVEFDHEHGKWRANFKLFDDVVSSPTPKCSAQEMAALNNGTGILSKEVNGEEGPYVRKAFSHQDSLNSISGNSVSGMKEVNSRTRLIDELKDSLAENRF